MQLPEDFVTEEEYFEIDRQSETRVEYYAGHVYDLAGGTYRHALIKERIATVLRKPFLSPGCEIITSDLRVRIEKGYVYPDVVVVCGEPEISKAGGGETLTNPRLLVEVLSPSTSHRDQTWKVMAYTRIPTLTEFWLAETDDPAILLYTRHGDLWQMQVVAGADAVLLLEDFSIPLSEIYA